MTVKVLFCIHGSDDPYFDHPALLDLPALPVVGDVIHFRRDMDSGPYADMGVHVVIVVRGRQFDLDKSCVQIDCEMVDPGHRPPLLREVNST